MTATGWVGHAGQSVRVDVLSITGQAVYHLELDPTLRDKGWQTQVTLGEGLANGKYLLQVSTEDGQFRKTLPFVLNR